MQVKELLSRVLIILFALLWMSRKLDEDKKGSFSLFYLFISLGILICIAGFRNNIGDTFAYVDGYNRLADIHSVEQVFEGKDSGFTFFTLLLYQISTDPQLMIFVTAFITQVCYIRFFYKYRSLLELQVYIYIASGYYIVTMNGIRQAFAAGIIVLGTKYLIDKKFIKFGLTIIFASVFHQSALIMIPIYFIVNMKPWTKKTVLIIAGASIAFILYFTLLPILIKLLENTQYANYFEVLQEGEVDGVQVGGANPIRLLITLVPLILAYIKKDELAKWKCSNIFINMAIINFIFMLFSLRIWIFARFCIYFNLYNCILLPKIISIWANDKERRMLYIFLIIFYFIFFLREHAGLFYGTNYSIQRLFYSQINM